MDNASNPPDAAQDLLRRLRAFCFPGGEDMARGVAAIRITERGEFRSAPNARWIPFTAEQEIDATRSRFRWDARFGGGRIALFRVTDAYENGRGWAAIRAGGVIPVKKAEGPAFDQGELQRYLASVSLCPPMILNHRSLAWSDAGPMELRVRDSADAGGTSVEVEIDEQGCPFGARAERPRWLGNQAPPTPWMVRADEFGEFEGIRIPRQTMAAWLLPEGLFEYYRSEVTSFAVSGT
jgi:hypothetical protein